MTIDQAKTSDALYADLRARLPGWVFRGLVRGKAPVQSPIAAEGLGVLAGSFIASEPAQDAQEAIAKDPVYGTLCDVFADYYVWLDGELAQCFIETAGGEWLDLHARDRGYNRTTGEGDATLRERIRTAPQVATAPAIRQAVNPLIASPTRIQAIDYDARTVNLGSGPVEIAESAILADGDGTRIRFEDLTQGDHVNLGSHLVGGTPVQWLRRLVYVFTLRDRAAFDGDFMDQVFYGFPVLPETAGGDPPTPNGRNVAVLVLPPQQVSIDTFWDQAWLDQDFYGGVWEDTQRYASIRSVAERIRAAGIILLIWIQQEVA